MKVTEAEIRRLSNLADVILKKHLPQQSGKVLYEAVISKARELELEATTIKQPLQAAKFRDLIESVQMIQKLEKEEYV